MSDSERNSPRERISDFDSIDGSGELSDELWSELYEVSQTTFNRGLETIRQSRTETIEHLKIDLLLASVFVAAVEYSQLSGIPGNILAIPFTLLSMSATFFLLALSDLGEYTVGPGEGNLRTTINMGKSKDGYLKTMAVVYMKWSDENIDSHKSAVTRLRMGIILQFLSIGAFGLLLVLY